MALVVLVILTADKAFCDTLHNRLMIKRAEWFKEQELNNISLGSLSIIVLIRTVQKNMLKVLHCA